MAHNPERKAIVRSSGKEITVYALKKGGYADAKDCKTEYKEHELQFIN